MENKFLNFLKNNNIVFFSLSEKITTKLNKDGEEKKIIPFENFSWKEINKDNYEDYIDEDDETFIIRTGKISNITVVDFDDPETYEELHKKDPKLENYFTVKTNKGYHIYFKYVEALKTTTNILDDIDIRNDDGLIIAPPTKYKLLNGETAKYKYLYGTIQEMPLYLLNALLPDKKEQVKEDKKLKKGIKEEKKNFNLELKIKEITTLIKLFSDDRSSDYDDWTKIGCSIYHQLKEDGRQIYHDFSKICKAKYDKDECNKKYDSFETDREDKLGLSYLKSIAKEDNPEEYSKIYKTTNDPIKSTFTMLEKDIAEYVINYLLNNNFVCTQTKPPTFYYFNNIWNSDEGNQKILKILYNDLIKKYEEIAINSTNEDETEIIRKIIKRLKGKLTFINSIIDWIAVLTFNMKFFEIVDENPDLLAFNNGVYEINTKIFREGRREDYITKTVGYDFPNEDDYGHKKDIEQFLTRVFPDPEVRHFVLQTQAQSLSGRKTEDLVYTHTGRGGNGKSILIEIIKHTFGDYFLNIPVSLLTNQNNSGHNTPDPFLGKFKGIRFGMSNEPKDGAKFNDSIIKNIGSQEPLQYRLLYSNNPVTLNLQLKLNIFCNNKLKFNGEDQGIGRRMCVIDYISRFDKIPDEKNNIYLIDVELTDKVKNWKKDYMKLLLSLYKHDYKHNPPKSIIDASKMYIDGNNDVLKFVNDFYEKTNDNNDFLLLKEIKFEYQNNKQYEQTKLKTLKESLEKIFNTNFIEEKKIKGKKYRSVILGWRRKLDDSETDTETESEEKSLL